MQNQRRLQFSFQDVSRDIDRWMEKHGVADTLSDGTPVLRGLSKAETEVINAYFEKKAFDAIVQHVVAQNQIVDHHDALQQRLVDVLVREGQLPRLKRLWRGILAKRKLHYTTLATFQKKTPDRISAADVAAAKQWVLEGLEQLQAIVRAFSDTEMLAQVADEIARTQSGASAKLKGKPDARKIDAKLFWELIDVARASAPSMAEQILALQTALEAFRAAEIKNFRRLLEEHMQRLYHYDVWALAFLAQDGCSDDAFEEFRAWLILQGEALCQLLPHNLEQAAQSVPRGQHGGASDLLLAPYNAYERRAGKPLLFAKRKLTEPTGVPWSEGELALRFPELARRYQSAD